MKVKLDENIPDRLVTVLTNGGHDVETVVSEGLKGTPDSEVWSAARNEDRFLITQDLDFSDVRQFQPGTHAGANALVRRIGDVVREEGLDSFARCFVVLTDRKLRIRRP
jgi:Domain of unknown function (DUF5615)